MRRATALLLVTSIALSGCADDVPMSLLVRVEIDAALAAPASLKLRVIDAQRGVVVDDRRVPEKGAPELPSDVVLYPPSESTLGLWMRAFDGAGAQYAQAAERATPVPGEQRVVRLVLRGDKLGDADGDGVPDAIDRCPGRADPTSGPCPESDGGFDGDASADGDASIDGPADADAGNDGDSTLDGLDGTVDTSADSTVDLPLPCTTNAECDDSNVCTTDQCVSNKCQHTAVTCPSAPGPCKVSSCNATKGCQISNAPLTTSCDDGKYCTVSDHCNGNGACVGGAARVCPATVCQTPSCNESAHCQTANLADGTFCADSDPCTQGETCQSGKCVAPSGPVTTLIGQQLDVSSGGRPMVSVDSSGAVRAVYSDGNTLRWARRLHTPGATFNSYVVSSFPSAATFLYPSMAVGGNDTVHLALFDDNDNRVRYANLPSGAGGLQGVTALQHSASGWLAIAAQGSRVHIAYVAERALRYATSSGGAFSDQVIAAAPATTSKTAMSPSMVIDSQGAVHVAFGQGTLPGTNAAPVADVLRYATNRGGTFVVVNPSGVSGDHGSWPVIAVSPSGAVAIAHSDYRGGAPAQAALWVTSKASASGAFSDTQVDSGGISHKAMVMNNAGRLHILYRVFGATPDEMRYATNAAGNGSTFSKNTLDTRDGAARWVSMVRASDGQLNAVYEVDGTKRFEHIAISACP